MEVHVQLKPETSRFLNGWLGIDSWKSPHSNDMNRWYDFISQYQRDHGYALDERGLVEEIEQRHRQRERDIGPEERTIIESRVNLARQILEFLERTRR
jgi:hypothetical protein